MYEAHARKEMSGYAAVYFLREIVARIQEVEEEMKKGDAERTKRRMREACLEHPDGAAAVQDGVHARWFPVFSVFFSRLNS